MYLLVVGSLAIPPSPFLCFSLPLSICTTHIDPILFPLFLHADLTTWCPFPPSQHRHSYHLCTQPQHTLVPPHPLSIPSAALLVFSASCSPQLPPSSLPLCCWLGHASLRPLLAWLATAALQLICHGDDVPKTPDAVSFQAVGACGSVVPGNAWWS